MSSQLTPIYKDDQNAGQQPHTNLISEHSIARVAGLGLRLNSLRSQLISLYPFSTQVTSIIFINGLHHPLQPSFLPFFSTITLQVKLSTTRHTAALTEKKLHHLVAT